MRAIYATVFALFISLTAFSQIQSQAKPPSIDVTGTADIMIAPDQVIFTLDVTKRNKDMNIAKSETDAVLAKILDITRRFGVDPTDVRTDYISVEKKNQSLRDPQNRIFDEEGDEIGTMVFLGYDVSTTVIVKLKDLNKFEQFFAEVLKTGLSEVETVRFESSRMIEERSRARQMAMKAAYEKASSMAGAINQTVGKAISITEVNQNDSRYSNTVNSNYVSGNVVVSEPVATFSPGSIKISSQVNVTFLLN